MEPDIKNRIVFLLDLTGVGLVAVGSQSWFVTIGVVIIATATRFKTRAAT